MRSKKEAMSDSRPKSRATTATLTYEKAMSRLTLDQILSLPQSKYDTIGVKDAGCVRSLRDLQTWWSKSSPGSRAVSLNLINYYSSPSDTRTLGQCILDSQDALVDRFIKTFPSGQSRTREACKALSSSLYPISRRQLDCYIKKYGDKVDLARVSHASICFIIHFPPTLSFAYRCVRISISVCLLVLQHFRCPKIDP